MASLSQPPQSPSFNLVDEPWIPCMRAPHAPPTSLSLRQVFAQAPTLWQIADPSPVVTISLHRLLLAILHRSLRGPRDAAEWARVSARGAWDTAAIDTYLTTWRHRFDLFDTRYPFYQTPGLPVKEDTGSATQLTPERASSRNKTLLFDHTTSERAELTPAEAARALLAQHNFSVGGTFGYISAHEPIANKYVSMAPLLGAAVCLVRGSTLFETLMLNWVHYSPSDGKPFPFRADDQPAWERDTPTAPSERIPDGYADLLTWQSRRILLVPASSPDGQTIVAQAVLMKGYHISPSFDRWTGETMAPFRKSAKAKASDGAEPWYPLSLRSDRFIWRDSQALLRSMADDHLRPQTLDWLYNLMLQNYLGERRIVPLDVYGMIPDQANIEDWRRESLPLPLALLRNDTLVEKIEQAVALAESVSRLLMPGAVRFTREGKTVTTGSPLSALAEALLVGTSGRSPDTKAREALVNSFGAPLRYWAQLDTPFRQFVIALAHEATLDAEGQRHDGPSAFGAWASTVDGAVRRVFLQITADLDTSARALRAIALAQSRFTFCLSSILAPYRPELVTSQALPPSSDAGETHP